MTYVLISNRRGEDTQSHRKEGRVKTETERLEWYVYRSVITKECWQPWKLGEKHGKDSPSGSPEETSHADSLILDFLPPEL